MRRNEEDEVPSCFPTFEKDEQQRRVEGWQKLQRTIYLMNFNLNY